MFSFSKYSCCLVHLQEIVERFIVKNSVTFETPQPILFVSVVSLYEIHFTITRVRTCLSRTNVLVKTQNFRTYAVLPISVIFNSSKDCTYASASEAYKILEISLDILEILLIISFINKLERHLFTRVSRVYGKSLIDSRLSIG